MTTAKPAINALAPFVGVWNTQGRIRSNEAANAQRLVATDIYEWLPGKHFLLHRVDARLADQVVRSIEIIGWDAEAGALFSTSYDDKGSTSRFACALDGHDWRIDGDGIRFRGTFDNAWGQLTGTWEMMADGVWKQWMDIQLSKAD